MFKDFFKKIIISILTYEAKFVLQKHNPKIVAITGSVGKTSTKEAVSAVLEQEFNIRKNVGSYNSEIGVPLVVLGLKNPWYSYLGWIKNIILGALQIIKKQNYPRILILELGADKPGDIGRFMDWIKPDVSVITALGDIPAHIEFFASPEALRSEKAKIIKTLKPQNKAVLNFDDETVLELREKTKAEIISFGVGQGAQIKGSNYKIVFTKKKGKEIPLGITFKVDYKGASVPFRIMNTFGRQQMYACLAAAGVGIAFGLNLVKISEFLSRYESPPGRLKLLSGIKKTLILDDTYNASPMATHAALDVLADLPSQRKIAVLGDMMQLGRHAVGAHKEMGQLAAKVCDAVFTVGQRAKFIAEEMREIGFSKENIFEFNLSKEAGAALQNFIKEGDLILIKGSQAMRMELAVEEIMANPEDKNKLLVRQNPVWKTKIPV